MNCKFERAKASTYPDKTISLAGSQTQGPGSSFQTISKSEYVCPAGSFQDCPLQAGSTASAVDTPLPFLITHRLPAVSVQVSTSRRGPSVRTLSNLALVEFPLRK